MKDKNNCIYDVNASRSVHVFVGLAELIFACHQNKMITEQQHMVHFDLIILNIRNSEWLLQCTYVQKDA